MEGDTDSFIVRIWREAVDSAGNVVAWKGFIEQVGCEEYLFFQDLELIARFIANRCRLPPRKDESERASSLSTTEAKPKGS